MNYTCLQAVLHLVPIESNGEEMFRKRDEIWNKITELISINNSHDFIEIDDDENEFIMLEVEKNTSAIRDKYRNDLVFVFTSVFNNLPRTLLVQCRY